MRHANERPGTRRRLPAGPRDGPFPGVPERRPRAERFDHVLERLSPIERFNVRFVRASFERPFFNALLRHGQRWIGASWIYACTRRLLRVVGQERLPPPDAGRAVIWASNHRSFFDMYVANAWLFRQGYHERILYPVRSTFFYDHPLGLPVNGLMSFWSMYPPVFRDRKRLALNHTAFSELARAVREGRSVGIHPEGTRNRGDDPYALLPAQSGVGRLMHLARAPVLPFFINGLQNDLVRQVRSNFDGTGAPIVVVFGAPLELGDLLERPATGKTYREIAERVMERIAELGEEERAVRAQLLEADREEPLGTRAR
jgi:1-acyl-sn-glycerol-3-phosphate acyltransferase